MLVVGVVGGEKVQFDRLTEGTLEQRLGEMPPSRHMLEMTRYMAHVVWLIFHSIVYNDMHEYVEVADVFCIVPCMCTCTLRNMIMSSCYSSNSSSTEVCQGSMGINCYIDFLGDAKHLSMVDKSTFIYYR